LAAFAVTVDTLVLIFFLKKEGEKKPSIVIAVRLGAVENAV
jgi:hypothetical protein